MCYILFAIVNIINSLLHLIFKTIMTIFAMFELLIKTVLQIIFNSLLMILQLLSVIPVCCAFIITSKLKCLVCRRGPACSIIRGGFSELILSLILFSIIILILRLTGVLDTLLKPLGYVNKGPKKLFRVAEDVSQSPLSFSQVQYVTDYDDVDEQIRDMTSVSEASSVSSDSSSNNVKSKITDFRGLFKPEQYISTTETMPNLWNLPFGIL